MSAIVEIWSDKGQNQFHAEGCADIEKQINKIHTGTQGKWEIACKHETLKEAITCAYSDFLESGEMQYEDAIAEANIKPCAKKVGA